MSQYTVCKTDRIWLFHNKRCVKQTGSGYVINKRYVTQTGSGYVIINGMQNKQDMAMP